MRRDHELHLLFGAGLSWLGVLSPWLVLTGFAAGVGKEAWDMFIGTGKPEWSDVWWTWAGASIGSVAALAVGSLGG